MKIRALIIRIIRQFIHDKRTLALLIIAPILVLSLLFLVFNGDSYEPKIGTVQVPTAIIESLSANHADVTVFDSVVAAQEALANRNIDAIFQIRNGAPYLHLEGSDSAKNAAAAAAIQRALQEASSGTSTPAITPTLDFLHGSADMTTFDYISPPLIGFFAFFFVFLIAGVSFLRERTSGTLERLLATPLRRSEIVIGYMVGFGIFTSLQAVLIAGYAVGVLGSPMVGSFWYILLIMLLLSMAALSFGTFLSAFANTEFQMIQFIPIVIVPQVFFSGLFDLESISPWLRWISWITPLKYGADALRSVMIRGAGWQDIATQAYVLLALTVIFMTANVLALRKHRKI